MAWTSTLASIKPAGRPRTRSQSERAAGGPGGEGTKAAGNGYTLLPVMVYSPGGVWLSALGQRFRRWPAERFPATARR